MSDVITRFFFFSLFLNQGNFMTRSSIAHRMLAVSVAALSLAGGTAMAESQYGSGTGTITAQAKVKLSVTVPKLIVLRVGANNALVDQLSWTSALGIPGVPTTPLATAANTNVDWSGAAPTVTTTTAAGALTVYAWTNAGAGTINCALGAWNILTGGPANADFTVTTTGTLPHPGPNLGACASTGFPSNTVATGTWTYVLGGTPASWVANVYTNTITYTAQGV